LLFFLPSSIMVLPLPLKAIIRTNNFNSEAFPLSSFTEFITLSHDILYFLWVSSLFCFFVVTVTAGFFILFLCTVSFFVFFFFMFCFFFFFILWNYFLRCGFFF